jgi:hypothetical protein
MFQVNWKNLEFFLDDDPTPLRFRHGNSRVADMETGGSISAAEASAALASVRGSRARVAWTGYPRWYWLTTGAGFAAMPLATLLPTWLGVVLIALVAVLVARSAVVVGRARGVCEHWNRAAMRWQEVTLLYVPAVVVMMAGSFGKEIAWWLPIPAAVIVFVLFAGTGLMLTRKRSALRPTTRPTTDSTR